MTVLVTIAFLLAVTGSFLLLSLSPFAFLEGLAAYIKPRKTSIRSRVDIGRQPFQKSKG